MAVFAGFRWGGEAMGSTKGRSRQSVPYPEPVPHPRSAGTHCLGTEGVAAVHWCVTVSRPGGRGPVAPAAGSRKVRTPQGKGAGESQDGVTCRFRATESRPPMAGRRVHRWPAQARVKRCGKSAPASGATPAAGNPHPEQGQAWDGRPGRCPQVGRKDGWPPGGDRKETAHRIRLIGRLTVTTRSDQDRSGLLPRRLAHVRHR